MLDPNVPWTTGYLIQTGALIFIILLFLIATIRAFTPVSASPAAATTTTTTTTSDPQVMVLPMGICGGWHCGIPLAESTEPVTGSQACNGAPAAGWDDIIFHDRNCAFSTMIARGARHAS